MLPRPPDLSSSDIQQAMVRGRRMRNQAIAEAFSRPAAWIRSKVRGVAIASTTPPASGGHGAGAC